MLVQLFRGLVSRQQTAQRFMLWRHGRAVKRKIQFRKCGLPTQKAVDRLLINGGGHPIIRATHRGVPGLHESDFCLDNTIVVFKILAEGAAVSGHGACGGRTVEF